MGNEIEIDEIVISLTRLVPRPLRLAQSGLASAAPATVRSLDRASSGAAILLCHRLLNSRWCSWTPRRRFRPARWRSAGSFPPSPSMASSSRCWEVLVPKHLERVEAGVFDFRDDAT